MKTFRVKKSRKSEFDKPIKVACGENVKCMEDSDPNGDWAGWTFCKTVDNEGWIPYQIIDRSGMEARITEDYYAIEFDLEFDEKLVMEKEMNGWIWSYKIENPDIKAWAPLNCLEEISVTKGIIIFGSAGSGKTTLGKLLAKELGYPYYDLDDYIWKKDTEKPYTVMYSKEEKIQRLMHDISRADHFVMGGSMRSFNKPFIPFFELAVHLTASIEIRRKRLLKRSQEEFGDRVLSGGDLYEKNKAFIKNAENYDFDGAPSYKNHKEWADSLPCNVLNLDGENQVKENIRKIIKAYEKH